MNPFWILFIVISIFYFIDMTITLYKQNTLFDVVAIGIGYLVMYAFLMVLTISIVKDYNQSQKKLNREIHSTNTEYNTLRNYNTAGYTIISNV